MLGNVVSGDSSSRRWTDVGDYNVSDWLPGPVVPLAGDRCAGCRARLLDLRERMEASERRWASFLEEEGARGEERRSAAYPPIDLDMEMVEWEGSERLVFACRQHSCALGHGTRFPLVRFVQGREAHLPHSPHFVGVDLRIHFHLVLPGGAPLRWVTRFGFRSLFPLLGGLRRYWGRFLEARGVVVVMGERPSRGRALEVRLSDLRLRATIRRPGCLFVRETTGVARSALLGPRGDVLLQGASLQWVRSRSQVALGEEPEHASREELQASFVGEDEVWPLPMSDPAVASLCDEGGEGDDESGRAP